MKPTGPQTNESDTDAESDRATPSAEVRVAVRMGVSCWVANMTAAMVSTMAGASVPRMVVTTESVIEVTSLAVRFRPVGVRPTNMPMLAAAEPAVATLVPVLPALVISSSADSSVCRPEPPLFTSNRSLIPPGGEMVVLMSWPNTPTSRTESSVVTAVGAVMEVELLLDWPEETSTGEMLFTLR